MNILVPVDFSDATGPVTSRAVDLAEALGAHLILLHVLTPTLEMLAYGSAGVPAAATDGLDYVAMPDLQAAERHQMQLREKFDNLHAEIRTRHPNVDARLLDGVPGEQIIQEAKRDRCDMIVIGSHGHGAVYQLLVGSVTDRVLRHSPCPVLVVPVKKQAASV